MVTKLSTLTVTIRSFFNSKVPDFCVKTKQSYMCFRRKLDSSQSESELSLDSSQSESELMARRLTISLHTFYIMQASFEAAISTET